MLHVINKWKTQLRKGYLELCILSLISKKGRLYGFELLDLLELNKLPVKEGTLYPLLNRMTSEKILSSVWETENLSGHPRKFYSLTEKGKNILKDMQNEFEEIINIYQELKK